MARPDPSSDRLWVWFALSSVTLLVVLAISPLKDYFREYRRIQKQYRALLLRGAGSLQEVRRAEAQHLTVQRHLLRMCRGELVQERVEGLWASSGPEKG